VNLLSQRKLDFDRRGLTMFRPMKPENRARWLLERAEERKASTIDCYNRSMAVYKRELATGNEDYANIYLEQANEIVDRNPGYFCR